MQNKRIILKRNFVSLYSVYQGLGQAYIGYGGLVLGLSQYKVMIVAHVKSDQKWHKNNLLLKRLNQNTCSCVKSNSIKTIFWSNIEPNFVVLHDDTQAMSSFDFQTKN